MKSLFLVSGLNACTVGILFRKVFPMQISSSIFFIFCFIGSKVSGPMLKSLISLKLSLVQGKREEYFHSLRITIQLCQHHLLNSVFSPMYIIGLFVKNKVVVWVGMYVGL